MSTIRLLLAVLAVVSLSACAVTEVKGRVAGVKVQAGEDSPSHASTFCPPGQAKKGNC